MAQGKLTSEDFHFGAKVFAADGTEIGTLRRVLVDEESLEVHAIVAQETRRFSGHYFGGRGLIEDDIAISLSAIAAVTHERIDLNVPASAVRNTTPYLEYHTRQLTPGQMLTVMGGGNVVPPVDVTVHKGVTEVEITPGEAVFSQDDEEIGTVHDVLMDEGEFVGIVLHPHHLFSEDVTLQVRFLDRAEDGLLRVRISKDDLAKLTPFHPGED